MNPVLQSIKEQASRNANILHNQAVENEPRITADLTEIAAMVSANTAGLEYKFKTVKSLASKSSSNRSKLMNTYLKGI